MSLTHAAVPAATQPLAEVAGNSEVIQANLQLEMKDVRGALKAPGLWTSSNKRAEVRHTIQPILQNELNEYDQLAAIDPQYVPARDAQHRSLRELLAALDDSTSINSIHSEVDSKDPGTSLNGQIATLRVKWILSDADAVRQIPIATAVETLDHQFPENDKLTDVTYFFGSRAATPKIKNELWAAAASMNTRQADRIRAMAASKAKSAATLVALENKPLTVDGIQSDGKPFTTADWKGKVVLVDFWATWCGPCKAELPRVKKIYSDYHDKGLEILGVSNDFKKSDLMTFIVDDQMPWPELFDAAAAADHQFNPITEKFGISGIPMMFVIDKNGICRTTDGRSMMEKLIPQLLAEHAVTAMSKNVPQ